MRGSPSSRCPPSAEAPARVPPTRSTAARAPRRAVWRPGVGRLDRGSLGVVAANFAPALELAADLVLRPTFPEAGVGEERALQLAAIRRAFDSSSQRPLALAQRDLFGNHPYGIPVLGDEDSTGRIGAADLAAWWRDHVAAEDLTIVVVGDVEQAAATALVERAFAAAPRHAKARAAVRAPRAPATRTETIEFRERKQSAIVLAFAAPLPSDPDAPRLALLQEVTSGLAGTLFAELRGKRSLAYTVFATYQPRRSGGLAVAYLASDAAKEAEAKEALLSELRRLAVDGFDGEVLARGKSALAGSTLIDLETNGDLAAEIASNYLLGLGLDWTDRRLAAARSTTLEELRATAARVFGADRFATAILRGKS